MNACSVYDPPRLHPETSRTVTSFYPDPGSGLSLAECFHRALTDLGEGDTLDSRPWRLDFLQWPEAQDRALHDIACSDVVVVPADDAYIESSFFRQWAESWPAAPVDRQLLLASPAGRTENSPRVQRFAHWLEDLAERKGMSFAEFNADHVPVLHPQEQDAGGPSAPAKSASPPSKVLHAAFPDPEPPATLRFWGLNE